MGWECIALEQHSLVMLLSVGVEVNLKKIQYSRILVRLGTDFVIICWACILVTTESNKALDAGLHTRMPLF